MKLALSQLRLDGGTQPRAAMNFVTIGEYAEAMQQGVRFPPVTVFYDGTDYWLADGFHRVKATEQAGLGDIDADVRQGTQRDAILFSVGANAAHGMRRTNEDKRRAVMTLLSDAEWQSWPDGKIAQACGVSREYVVRMRPSCDQSQDRVVTVERNGTTYTMNTANIGRPADPTMQQQPELPSHAPVMVAEAEEEKPTTFADVHFSSQSIECYTPLEIVGRVLEVFGEIDLDPCSNSHEEPNIPARSHYTQDDNGLSRQWHGRVYMNPPYGRELSDWIGHLRDEYKAGRVTEAIALVPSRTDTEWFRKVREYPRCFIFGRLRFIGQENSAPFPSMLVYMGDNLESFVEAFSDIGDIYQLV
jgi:hypothetical protein